VTGRALIPSHIVRSQIFSHCSVRIRNLFSSSSRSIPCPLSPSNYDTVKTQEQTIARSSDIETFSTSLLCKLPTNLKPFSHCDRRYTEDFMLGPCLEWDRGIEVAITKTLRIQKKEGTKGKKNTLYILVTQGRR
jgi:hypothetical protein